MANRKRLPSARLLRRLIAYDPSTGEMRWKERPVWMFSDNHYGRETLARMWNERRAGEIAFSATDAAGYKTGQIFSRRLQAHRVIFKMEFGICPRYVDHINHDPADNRLANLRAVTNKQNLQNASLSKANRSGVTGVFWHRRDRAWVARIRVDGRDIHLTQSKNKRAAIAARKAAERKYGFHPNHGRPK